jgi:hypothetical protein
MQYDQSQLVEAMRRAPESQKLLMAGAIFATGCMQDGCDNLPDVRGKGPSALASWDIELHDKGFVVTCPACKAKKN